MGSIGEILKPGLERARDTAEKLLKGISEVQFARQPVCDGKVVEANHPAFVFGHLSLYPARAMKLLDLNGADVDPGKRFAELFENGVKCLDDPSRSIYPPMDQIVTSYFKANDAFIAALPAVDDARLLSPHPDEARRARFGTIGGFIIYIFTVHQGIHLGQISTWRRCMGLGPA